MRISIGKSRKDVRWKVSDVPWGDLCKRLSSTRRTNETVAEYKAMTKDEKSACKDIGGFVGGVVREGRRTRSGIESRSLITLDADYADQNFADNAGFLCESAMLIYSTHSHTAKAPRLRVVLPLNREVTVEEYEPIARMIAKDLGIDQFDITTYEVNRLMYWPSTSQDGEFIYRQYDGEFVDADEVLARYEDWRNAREWPTGSSEAAVQSKTARAQGDPTEKPGLIGLFCRAYDVPSAIDSFLSDVYEPCEAEDRYTYRDGSSTAGVVIYQNGQFAYSHHATDPACGLLCNAFDLVRIHKFGDLDYLVDSETPVNKLPSYQKMCEFVQDDETCKELLVSERMEEVKAVFPEDTLPSESDSNGKWTSELKLTKSGSIEVTVDNLILILKNDPNLKGCIAMNEFTNKMCVIGNLPWRKCSDTLNGIAWTDADDSSMRWYVEKTYGIYSKGKLDDAVQAAMQQNAFHPIRNYLNGLVWDGEQRAERLFVDVFGAENDEYTRAVTRKWLTGAVSRVMRPGCKFDNMIVLVGAQGIGKSYMGKLLGKDWYSDTFNTFQGKESYEQLNGVWIIEMGELSAMKRAEVEGIKLFISKQEDTYRAAYARHTKENKRQCVFYGTTNDDDFLRDRTGNRRFWPIRCNVHKPSKSVFDLTPADIDMIWAEVKAWYDEGESLYLDAQMTEKAAEVQQTYTEDDPRIGEIEQYLDRPVPTNWYSMSKEDRRNYIQGYLKADGSTMRRTFICSSEIGYELYGIQSMKLWEAREFNNILRAIPNWKNQGKMRVVPDYGKQRVFERVGDRNENQRGDEG